MIIDIEVPDLATVLAPPVEAKEPAVVAQAAVSDLYFEEGDEIEEGDVLAVLFNDHGTCEIVAPASGVLISLPYNEGDTVTSEAVLAKIETDR
jgi:pyruvate/2-oxoglutarate dehydrogenase complex dihydrolipoamide acyltransferase (E2) component